MTPRSGRGPVPAGIVVVGEAWGADEERLGEPFVGASGQELNRMLHEAGIMRSECFVSNLVNARPPNNDLEQWIPKRKSDITSAHVPLLDKMVLPIVLQGWQQLQREIELVKPRVIVTVGNYAMWALTGKWGINKWRGSLLTHSSGTRIIPTFHPANILRSWSDRAIAVHDLRQANRAIKGAEPPPPAWRFDLRPSFSQVISRLDSLQHLCELEEPWIELDLETRAGHIACCGLSWSSTEALSIPFMCVESREGYWSLEEEAQIIWKLYKLLISPRIRVRWQNGLYDAQYIFKHWHFIPRGAQDTMISQHTLFAAMPKSLAFQSSMYSQHYVYWKDEGKDWASGMGEDQLWSYNCLDCVRTREVGEVELALVEQMGQQAPHQFQQELFWPVLQAMTRGIKVIPENQKSLLSEVQDALGAREQLLAEILGHPFNPRSSPQMQKLFYEDLKQKPIFSRPKKGKPATVTCNDEALTLIATREPLLKPLVGLIADIRTLGIFQKNFLLAQLDDDGRMRCSYNIGGSTAGESAPYTFRLSSSENAFGGGTNLQNIPSEKSKSVGKAAARGVNPLIGKLELPNIRSMFGPDPGFTFFDMDLDRADLQVVVWEADDQMLKHALGLGVDIHLLNAFVLAGKEPPPLEELVESHPRYPDHREPMKLKREFAKVFVHGTNYGGSARTMAVNVGATIHETERAQAIWFGAHPGIKLWHERTKAQIQSKHEVVNKFGYHWHIFDRIDGALGEALAWVPQSTVGCLINRIWMNIYKNLPEVQVLLQVHDSIAGQFPTHLKDWCLARMREEAHIQIPYEDPLIIPVGIKTSNKSWGECQ